MSIKAEDRCAETSQYALQQVEERAKSFAKHYDECALSALGILVAVAIIVEHQERIGHESGSCSEPPRGGCDAARLYEISAAYGHKAEECPYQEIATAHVGEESGIEESKHYACCTDAYETPPTVGQQETAHGTCQDEHHNDAALHRLRRDPTLRTGTFGAEPVFTIGAFCEVEEVVDKVGCHLHQCCEEAA